LAADEQLKIAMLQGAKARRHEQKFLL